MAGKSKGREKFKLESTAILENGEPSKYYYTIAVKKGSPALKLMKYDPRVRKHVLFERKKLK